MDNIITLHIDNFENLIRNHETIVENYKSVVRVLKSLHSTCTFANVSSGKHLVETDEEIHAYQTEELNKQIKTMLQHGQSGETRSLSRSSERIDDSTNDVFNPASEAKTTLDKQIKAVLTDEERLLNRMQKARADLKQYDEDVASGKIKVVKKTSRPDNIGFTPEVNQPPAITPLSKFSKEKQEEILRDLFITSTDFVKMHTNLSKDSDEFKKMVSDETDKRLTAWMEVNE